MRGAGGSMQHNGMPHHFTGYDTAMQLSATWKQACSKHRKRSSNPSDKRKTLRSRPDLHTTFIKMVDAKQKTQMHYEHLPSELRQKVEQKPWNDIVAIPKTPASERRVLTRTCASKEKKVQDIGLRRCFTNQKRACIMGFNTAKTPKSSVMGMAHRILHVPTE